MEDLRKKFYCLFTYFNLFFKAIFSKIFEKEAESNERKSYSYGFQS